MGKTSKTTQKSVKKSKVLASELKPCINIHPRVVLQRVDKDYTFGVSTSSDNHPSTSSYCEGKPEQSVVDSNNSASAGVIDINIGKDNLVISDSNTSKNSDTDKNKDSVPFKVPQVTETDKSNSNDDINPECSFYSSPGEVLTLDENNSERDGICRDQGRQGRLGRPSEIAGSQEIHADEEINTPGENNTVEKNPVPGESKASSSGGSGLRIGKTPSLLSTLINAYEKDKEPTLGDQTSEPNTVKDCVVRVWLSVYGQKKKKKFHVKLSQLLSQLERGNHPLYAYRNIINVENLKYFTRRDVRQLATTLAEFVCAHPVTTEEEHFMNIVNT